MLSVARARRRASVCGGAWKQARTVVCMRARTNSATLHLTFCANFLPKKCVRIGLFENQRSTLVEKGGYLIFLKFDQQVRFTIKI